MFQASKRRVALQGLLYAAAIVRSCCKCNQFVADDDGSADEAWLLCLSENLTGIYSASHDGRKAKDTDAT